MVSLKTEQVGRGKEGKKKTDGGAQGTRVSAFGAPKNRKEKQREGKGERRQRTGYMGVPCSRQATLARRGNEKKREIEGGKLGTRVRGRGVTKKRQS